MKKRLEFLSKYLSDKKFDKLEEDVTSIKFWLEEDILNLEISTENFKIKESYTNEFITKYLFETPYNAPKYFIEDFRK